MSLQRDVGADQLDLQRDVGAEKLEGVADAVHVGALVVVRGVDAGADEAVSDVEAGRERGLDIRAVVRVDVDGVVELLGFRCGREVAHDVIVVRAARVLGADRNHALGAAEVRTHATHVDADHVAGVLRHDAATVADLLVDREQQGDLAAERDLAGGDGAGKSDEDRGGELVIQEAALDVAALRDRGAWVHGDDVTCLNTQSQDLVLRGYVLVEEDLHVLLDLLDLVVGDVGGGLGVEDDAGVGAAVARVDGAVLAIRGAPLV